MTLGFCNCCALIKKIDSNNNCFECINKKPNGVYKKCKICEKLKQYTKFYNSKNNLVSYCNSCESRMYLYNLSKCDIKNTSVNDLLEIVSNSF